MTLPKVHIEDLSVTFEGLDHPALDSVSLDIGEGELVVIAGPSGCGKSTLAYCMKGVIPHLMECKAEGKVLVDGLEVSKMMPAELSTRVGMVFQDPETQLCNLFVEDEIAFGPENLSFEPSEIEKRIEYAMESAQIDRQAIEGRFVYELSGGQKQRVAIAGVLAMTPDLIVFDEPSANLDPRGAIEAFRAIRRLHSDGHTVIVIEHKFDPFIDVADRLLILKEGRLELDGHPRELIAERGSALAEEYGLWLPEAARIAMRLGGEFRWDPIPLTADELTRQTEDYFKGLVCTDVEISSQEAMAGDTGTADIAVSFEGLEFTYPDGTEALQGVSASIPEGQVVAIVGENASGKTTLAKILVRLLTPAAGRVSVYGMDPVQVSPLEMSKIIGYVFQYPEHQFVKETVFDEVAYGLEVHGYPSDVIEDRVSEILDRFRLAQYRDRHPLSLSGGEKRRLSVATMLVLDPRVLILDEPTFGQDQANSHAMMTHLLSKMVADRSMTTLLITHDVDLVARYCDRVLVLKDGKKIFDGPPYALFGADEHLLTRGAVVRTGTSQYVHNLRRSGCDVDPRIIVAEEFIDWYNGLTIRKGTSGPMARL